MKLKYFRWLMGFEMLAVVIGLQFQKAETIGFSAQWVNGKYTCSGGSDPIILGIAIALLTTYGFLMTEPGSAQGKPLPGVLRRFVAFWLDFTFAMLATLPLIGIVPMIVEWRRTGEFAWSFSRDTYMRGDGLLAATLVPFGFIALAVFNALPLVLQRPTPGTCIMGYQVLSDEGTKITWKLAVLRVVAGFAAACSAWLAPFVGRDKKRGKFWLDKVFSTHAVRL